MKIVYFMIQIRFHILKFTLHYNNELKEKKKNQDS